MSEYILNLSGSTSSSMDPSLAFHQLSPNGLITTSNTHVDLG